MAGSALSDVVSAILSILQAEPVMSNCPVYDGAPVSESKVVNMVTIGDDADPESEAGNTFSQDWLDLAQTRRMETGEVVCAVVANSGSTDLSTQRETAFTLMGTVDARLRTDKTLGGVVMVSSVTTGSMRSFQNSAGSAVVIPFVVRYSVII